MEMRKTAILFILITAVLAASFTLPARAAHNSIPADMENAVDLNGDGVCSIKDVNLILLHIVHKEQMTGETLKKADINKDGTINVTDATALNKIIIYTVVPVKKVSLNETSVLLHIGETKKLVSSVEPYLADDKTLTYTSSDPEIAKVDQNGVITGVSIGSAKITAAASNGVDAVCSVTVDERKVESIEIDTDAVYLYAGGNHQLKVNILPDNADNKTVRCKSSNENVASVDSNGLITAKKAGLCMITVYSNNGKSASCFVNVYDRAVKYENVYTSAAVKRDCTVLEKLFPDLITYSSIGKTAKGDSIPMITLGKGTKKVCVVAAMHSREILTSSHVMRCAEEYAKAYVSNTLYSGYNVRELLNRYTIYIVPCCNPDGMDIYSANASPLYDYPNLNVERLEFKSNANGVNLNRNFPFCWDQTTLGAISGRTSVSQTYKGSSAGSEPETQALINLCASNRFEWMFSMHLRGNVVYWRDATNPVTEADKTLSSALRDKCGFYLMPTSTDINGYGGGFENYFRYRYGRPGFCVELVPSGLPSPEYPSYYNTIFDTATRWDHTKYIFLEALSKT